MGGRPGAQAVKSAPSKVSFVLPPEILKTLRHTAVMVTLVFLFELTLQREVMGLIQHLSFYLTWLCF